MNKQAEWSTLLDLLKDLLMKYLGQNSSSTTQVIEYQTPDQLRNLINLTLPTAGTSQQEIVALIESIFKNSARTGHACYFHKLSAGSDPIGVIADALISVLNVPVHVFTVSPVLTMIELSVVDELCRMVGYVNGGGCCCPGGSYSNLLAMLTARNILYPQSRTAGLYSMPELVVFTSVQAHFSIVKNANAIGIGENNVIRISCTADGMMNVLELEKEIMFAIEQKKLPFLVCSTSGTTVLGAFDPIDEISVVCKKYKLWLHVDGSWGGSVIFSAMHRQKLRSIELADSFVFNPHKLFGVPQQCSVLLCKEKVELRRAHKTGGVDYLMHDDDVDGYDMAEYGIACGRRADALKFFLAWKWYGSSGFEQRVNVAVSNAKLFHSLLVNQSDVFEIYMTPTFSNICFWYFPTFLRHMKSNARQFLLGTDVLAHEVSEEIQWFRKSIDTATKLIHRKIIERGNVMIDYAPLRLIKETCPSNKRSPTPCCFRMVLISPDVEPIHLEKVIKEICLIGDTLNLRQAENNNK